MRYLLSSSLFSGFGALVTSLKGHPRSLLSDFNLPLDIEARSDHYMPFTNAAMLFEHCADSLNCPDFGLRLSQLQGLSVLGPVAVLARNAATVDAAVRGIGDYLHLITPAITVRFEVKASEGVIRAVFSIMEDGLIQTRQLYELCMGNGQLIVQMLIGSEVYADKMYFPHNRLAPEQSYRQLFKCDLAFNQDICAVDLPVSIMQQRLIQADKETSRIASDYLAERYGGKTGTLREQINHLVNRLLPTGHCNINVIAEQIGLHPRTLQRRLSEHNDIFENLVDEQRKLLAQRYLAESDLRLTQVTGLLGYADQSALNRSCKRWFDQTPLQIRRQSNKPKVQ